MKLLGKCLAACLLIASTAAKADPGVMVGVSYNFGGTVGFTVKAVSDNNPNELVAAAGVSFFPWEKSSKWGVDLGAGYNYESNTTITAGWDFLNGTVQMSGGYMNMDNDESANPVIIQKPTPPPVNPV